MSGRIRQRVYDELDDEQISEVSPILDEIENEVNDVAVLLESATLATADDVLTEAKGRLIELGNSLY